MKRRWQFLIGILAALIILALVTAAIQIRQVSSGGIPLALRQPLIGQPAKPMTLLEVWDIASERARKWSDQAGIGRLTSVDHPSDVNADSSPGMEPGMDGRRRAWQAILVSPSLDKEVWLTIWDGVIIDETEQPSGSGLKPFQERPLLDSPQAFVTAHAARPELSADHRSNHGYQYGLTQGADGKTTLVVTGQHHGNVATIELDARSGSFLGARERDWGNLGGVLFSSDAGLTWHASNLVGKVVSGVYADPTVSNSGYASVIEGSGVAVYRTRDGGATWELHSDLPDQAGDWPLGLCIVKTKAGIRLIAGTRTGTWLSEDGKTWSRVMNLPIGQGQWFAVIQVGEQYRVFASVTSGETIGLYASDDLTNWTLQAAGYYRLSESYDKTSMLATDATNQSTKALRFSLNAADQIDVPVDALDAAGDFKDQKPSLLRTGAGVSAFAASRPARTVNMNIASISASADFGTTGVAIAGGFRAGIYRTTDGGQTWSEVLHNPSDLVAGSNEIGVQFLSQNSVVAINGGLITWQEF